jgi:MFS family permease
MSGPARGYGGPPTGARAPGEEPRTGWRATFASLSIPEYSLYFYGMTAFFSGMNMMIILRGFLVFDMTGSTSALAIIMLSVSLPMLIFAPIGGVVADRVDRKALMIYAQAAVCLLNLLNTILIAMGVIEFWHLIVLSTLSGIAFSFNMPARQAAVPNLVPRHMIMNAMSLATSSMNGTRIVAPAVGGLLVDYIGFGGGFAVLTGLYAISVVLSFGLPSMPAQGREDGETFISDFTGGFKFIAGNKLVSGLILLGLVPMVFAMPYQTMLPALAEDVWDVGATGFGIMQAMAGAGGLLGALFVANLDRSPHKGRVMLAAAVTTGAFLILFAMSPWFLAALPLLAVVGLTQMVFMTVNNTVITSVIPDNVRGRVMSVMMMSFGLMPLGAVPAGIAAEFVGVEYVVAAGGLMLMISVLLAFTIFPRFRTLDTEIQAERADRDAEHAASEQRGESRPYAAAGR